jgi:hypothetical protein
MNRSQIRQEVIETLGGHDEDFDVDAIVSDLEKLGFEVKRLDDVDSEKYWGIVENRPTIR